MVPRRPHITIDLEIDAEDAIDRMKDIKKRLKNLKPVFRWARDEIEKANAMNFAAGGLPNANRWPKRDEDSLYGSWSVKRVSRFGFRPVMMVRTGNLFSSLTRVSDHSIRVIDKTSAEFGTDVEYAKFHQYGTSKMPKRKIVYTPQSFPRDLASKVGEFIVDGRDKESE
jgi:phage gpG-like protein